MLQKEGGTHKKGYYLRKGEGVPTWKKLSLFLSEVSQKCVSAYLWRTHTVTGCKSCTSWQTGTYIKPIGHHWCWRWVSDFSNLNPDALKMHFLVMLYIFCKTFLNYLNSHYKTLFFVNDFFENLYIQNTWRAIKLWELQSNLSYKVAARVQKES